MKQNQKLLLVIILGIVIFLNVLLLSWLLSDFFSGPYGPEKTVAATDGGEENTAEEVTTTEETGTGEITLEPTAEEITTEEPSTEATIVEEKKISLEEAKRVIHTFSWGEGEDQLGYKSDVHENKSVRGFSVEDDQICVWDDANRRILIYENGSYSSIETEYFSGNSGMSYQNGWVGLLDESKVQLYRSDRSREISIKLPAQLTNMMSTPQKIVEIGDTSVVLEFKMMTSNTRIQYRYDWVTDQVERITDYNIPEFFKGKNVVDVIGVHDDIVYYEDTEMRENVLLNVIGLKTENCHLYVEINQTDHLNKAKQNVWSYLSEDGRLYIMECFKDRVEISEIKLTIK